MRVELPGRGLHLEAESHGKSSDPAVVLIMGLGMQLIFWPEPLIEALVSGGFRVIVFDNRDCGRSGVRIDPAHTAPAKALLAHLFRRPFRPAYRLSDMADDTLALADALQLGSFHLVGVSLGGMVAQTLAARHPDRVSSLASIMSSAGPDTAPWPKPSVLRKFLHRPPRRGGRQARIDHTLRLLVAIGRLRDAAEIDGLRERVARAVDRAWRPDGIARQLLAVLADRDRSDEVARIQCPTLILHGADDPLIRLPAAFALQKRIPHAELEIIQGMAHYLPQACLPQITAMLLRHLVSADVALSQNHPRA